MCKFNSKNDSRVIDSCMIDLIEFLQIHGIKTLACCCGHGKYPMTIICKWDDKNFEIISYKIIPRKKKFYKKDKQGYYYIPESVED